MSVEVNSSEAPRKYSVYELWIAGEEHPFYVGKGTKYRAYSHLSLARKGDISFKSNKIRKAWRLGLDISIEYILHTDVEEVALEEEKRLIKFYGRRDNCTGLLVNLTDGGDGLSGRIFSDDHRRKLSDAQKGRPGRPHSDESKLRMKEAAKGRIISDEQKKKISASMSGRTLSEDHRKKISLSAIGKTKSDEHRLNISKARKDKKSPHLSLALKGNKNGLGNKGRLGETLSSEHRLKISNSMKIVRSIRTQTNKNLAYLNNLLGLS